VAPGTAGSVRLDGVPEPDAALGSVVVEALAAGICGTDAEIASGSYGWPPPGRDRLILGHESLGRVVDAGPSGFLVGEHVVGIVRRPDPAPCPNCAVGEWDMCSNCGYTERGIKQADGFMAERWRIEPDYAVRVDKDLGYLGVLLEPATVVAKAWEHIAVIGRRTFWDPYTVLVIGAGPIGLLAALIGVQQGADAHVLDRVTSGQKPALVRQLGATYHTGAITGLGLQPDIVVECTGVVGLIRQAMETISPGGIVCLTRSRLPHCARHVIGGRAGDRRGAQEHRAVRLGEREPAALLPRGQGARRGGPVVAGTAGDPARPPRPGRTGPAAGTGRHQGRHGIRAAVTGPEPGSVRPAEDSAGNAWTVTPCSAEPGRLSEGPRWDGPRNELNG